jgi:hypothetical protein
MVLHDRGAPSPRRLGQRRVSLEGRRAVLEREAHPSLGKDAPLQCDACPLGAIFELHILHNDQWSPLGQCPQLLRFKRGACAHDQRFCGLHGAHRRLDGLSA